MHDQLLLRVKNIQDEICVILARSGKHDDFVIRVRHCLQEGDTAWAKAEFPLACLKVHQGLIQIEDKSVLEPLCVQRRQNKVFCMLLCLFLALMLSYSYIDFALAFLDGNVFLIH